jgi:hypothetical protein
MIRIVPATGFPAQAAQDPFVAEIPGKSVIAENGYIPN